LRQGVKNHNALCALPRFESRRTGALLDLN